METPGLELRRYDGNTKNQWSTFGHGYFAQRSPCVRQLCGFFSHEGQTPPAAVVTPVQPFILRLLAGIVYR
jgi:hypothetical protein